MFVKRVFLSLCQVYPIWSAVVSFVGSEWLTESLLLRQPYGTLPGKRLPNLAPFLPERSLTPRTLGVSYRMSFEVGYCRN